jgi:hypothetical protein
MPHLNHDFYLLKKSKCDYEQDWFFCHYMSQDGDVILQDDIFCYISDTLQWIPTLRGNLCNNNKGYGFNYYGTTVIVDEGAQIAKDILTYWMGLFNLSPDPIQLTGRYVFEENEDNGHYDKLLFPKNHLILNFQKLIELCETVIRCKNRDYYILHAGI